MAENKPTTPEQQLLKLIEGQKPGAPGQAPAKAPKPRGRGLSLGRLSGSLASSFSFWKRRSKKRASSSRRPGFGLAEVNRALAAAAVFLLIYVVFDAAASARMLQKPPSFAPMKEAKPKQTKAGVAPLEETSYYLQKISARDIFREGKKEAPAPAAAPSPVTINESAEAVQSLALVGISWSSNPDAIIEDKAKQRTYFVKRGQDVGEGVKVEAIFKDHVVVTYEDREYELR